MINNNDYNSLFLNQRKTELFKTKKRNVEKPKMTNCIFCLENFNQNEIVNPILECKNHVHGKCLINYIETELNNNHFPIKCPICQNNQRHEINYKILLDSLLLNDKDDLAKKLETISLNHLAQTNPEIVTFCPTPGCSYMCFFDKASYHLNCPLCMKSYCLKCKTEWHHNLTCEQYQYQKNKKTEELINDQKFDEYIRGNNCKQCPQCKRWVEKINGCDHITCPCGIHFCYNCGGIRDSNRPYDHKCPPMFVNNNMFNNNNYNYQMNNMNNNYYPNLMNNNNMAMNNYNMNNNNNFNLMNNNNNYMEMNNNNMNNNYNLDLMNNNNMAMNNNYMEMNNNNMAMTTILYLSNSPAVKRC